MERLRIERILGSGTFGTVCVVFTVPGGQRYAAKVLREEHLQNPRVVARLRDEAMLLLRLQHPHIVRVADLLEIEGRPVLLMENIDGCNLEELLVSSPGAVGPGEGLELTRRVATALHAAWSSAPTGEPLRVIHRDIKPSNLLITLDGDVRVVDFGTAQGRFEGRESNTISMVLGARAYLAPERLDGAEDHPAGDVYALGHVLYELLTTQTLQLSLHPFHHRQMLDGALRTLAVPGWPAEAVHAAAGLLREMCAYSASHRPSHAAVAAALEDLLELSGAPVDLLALGQKAVRPLFLQRTRIEPYRHPAWADVSFLEGPDETAGLGYQEALGRLLSTEGWWRDPTPVQRLLARHPLEVPMPLVERLEKANQPWWRRWRAEGPGPEEILALLEALTPLTPQIVSQINPMVEGLRSHPDPAVRTRAANFVRP